MQVHRYKQVRRQRLRSLERLKPNRNTLLRDSEMRTSSKESVRSHSVMRMRKPDYAEILKRETDALFDKEEQQKEVFAIQGVNGRSVNKELVCVLIFVWTSGHHEENVISGSCSLERKALCRSD